MVSWRNSLLRTGSKGVLSPASSVQAIGAIRRKTGKTSVLPEFCKIECCGGSGGVPHSWLSYLARVCVPHRWQCCKLNWRRHCMPIYLTKNLNPVSSVDYTGFLAPAQFSCVVIFKKLHKYLAKCKFLTKTNKISEPRTRCKVRQPNR